MKLCKISNVAGTDTTGSAVSNVMLLFTDGMITCKLRFTEEDGKVVQTSNIEHCYQSYQDTLLFVTKSGSRYALEFSDEDYHGEFASYLALAMAGRFSSLKYCDLGKKIIEELR